MLLAGCASNQNARLSEPLAQQYIPKPENIGYLYAKLERTHNGYEFTSFSLNPENKEEPWVSLQHSSPLWDIETENCLRGLASAEMKCSTADEKLFRFDSTMSSKQAAAWGTLTVLSLGLWATMPPGQVQFDHKLYKTAYADAYSNFEEQLKENPANFILEFSLNYKDILAKSATADINSKIKNNTGFRFPYASPSDLSLSVTPFLKEYFSNINELNSYAKLLSEINTQNKHIDKAYKVNCNKTTIRDFSISQKCGKVEYNTQKHNLFANVTTEVLSKNRIRVAPSNLAARDKNFQVDITDRDITLKNTSDKFVTVRAISFYGDEGNIRTWTPSESLVLPPQSIHRRGVGFLIPGYDSLIKTIHTSNSASDMVNIKYSVAASYNIEGREYNISGSQLYRRLSDLKL